MKIIFADWTIAMAASNARQYDDNVWALDLTGELPEGWNWAALIAHGEHLDIIELRPNEAGTSAVLTAAQLSMDGYYTIQIRGTNGDQVRHTNLVQVFIPRSLSGDANWPTLPTEFSQAEARIAAASAHPPIPGEDGYWKIWDASLSAYVQSEIAVPAAGDGAPGEKGDQGPAGAPGVVVSTTEPEAVSGTHPVWINPDGESDPDGGTDLSLGLTGAKVGQIAKITEVDENGTPTKWEPVEMPSGGGEKWALLAEQTLEEAAKSVNIQLSSATRHFIAQMWCPKTEASSDPAYFNLGINGSVNNIWYYLAAKMPSKSNSSQVTVEAQAVGDGIWAVKAYANLGSALGNATNYNIAAYVPIAIKSNGARSAQSIKVETVAADATQYFPVGSVLRAWGIKEAI